MKLIVVTSPTYFVEEDEILTTLFEEGLDLLHIRKPNTQTVYLERLLRLIPKKYYNRIVLHDHFHLQKDFGLKGIHINDRNKQEPKNYIGNKSCSCHTLKEVEDNKSNYDYVFMCPIFNNISDNPTYPVYTTKDIEVAKESNLIDSKVMALGGVDTNNISILKKYGFGGAVILNDIWNRFNQYTDKDFMNVIKRFKEFKKLTE